MSHLVINCYILINNKCGYIWILGHNDLLQMKSGLEMYKFHFHHIHVFAWDVKAYFLGKIRKIFQKVLLRFFQACSIKRQRHVTVCLSGNVYMNMQVMTMFNLTNFRKKMIRNINYIIHSALTLKRRSRPLKPNQLLRMSHWYILPSL